MPKDIYQLLVPLVLLAHEEVNATGSLYPDITPNCLGTSELLLLLLQKDIYTLTAGRHIALTLHLFFAIAPATR